MHSPGVAHYFSRIDPEGLWERRVFSWGRTWTPPRACSPGRWWYIGITHTTPAPILNPGPQLSLAPLLPRTHAPTTRLHVVGYTYLIQVWYLCYSGIMSLYVTISPVMLRICIYMHSVYLGGSAMTV